MRPILRTVLQRKSHLCIPFLGIARPQSQFPHSCVCEGFIYPRIGLHISSTRIGRPIVGYINHSKTPECGNWDWDPNIPLLGIFVSKFRYFVFAVQPELSPMSTRDRYTTHPWILNPIFDPVLWADQPELSPMSTRDRYTTQSWFLTLF